ncbi:early transcribed membrane protein 11.1 [Plasmodium sp. gorilla clade G2]|uniref:early transcribed membrane protein 11.1 n=1 Tax=Plasmodium sp. gorilla clade G2 TaxID=880535 RepID=UPI000D2014C5|nr:early transcribed membrane protein 11.1 [Plasmodium sp. gorilla clade G2]SOV15281.1 early transcribed membrane protein 11.1 [Plasmodium sp. gorilla clade G2]
MKVTKILYFVFFMFALNFIAPNNEHNGYVEAKKKLTPAEIKKRNQKYMMYSAIASGIAVLLGASIGLGVHFSKQKAPKKKIIRQVVKKTAA